MGWDVSRMSAPLGTGAQEGGMGYHAHRPIPQRRFGRNALP